jgi:hypothetical protein
MITVEEAVEDAYAILRGEEELEFGRGEYEQWVVLQYFNIIRKFDGSNEFTISGALIVFREDVSFAQRAVRECLFDLTGYFGGIHLCLPLKAKEHLKLVEDKIMKKEKWRQFSG